MAQHQSVLSCELTFDAKKNREYFVGKLSCGCAFKRLKTAIVNKPPTRLACDEHPVKVEQRSDFPLPDVRSAATPNTPTTSGLEPSNVQPTEVEHRSDFPNGSGTDGTEPKAGDPMTMRLRPIEFVDSDGNSHPIDATKAEIRVGVLQPVRTDAEVSCRLDGDTICVPPLTEAAPQIHTTTSTGDESGLVDWLNSVPDNITMVPPSPEMVASMEAEMDQYITAFTPPPPSPPTESVVTAPVPVQTSITASAPVDPTEYDKDGKIVLNAAVLNRVFARMYPDKKPC